MSVMTGNSKPRSPLMSMVVADAKKSMGAISEAPSSKGSKPSIDEVTIKKAHGGFTVHCSGPGMYSSKPVIAANKKKAVTIAMDLLDDTESPKEDASETSEE